MFVPDLDEFKEKKIYKILHFCTGCNELVFKTN